jgi:hypothetical protein
MTKDYEWGTPTLGIAAAIKSLGAKYVRTDKTNTRSMVFYFCVPEDVSGLDKILGEMHFTFDEVERDYINGDLRVDAKAMYTALNELKSVIHSGK